MTDILADVLADSRVAVTRDLRESHAARARAAQARHKRFSVAFLGATAAAAIAGALILYGVGGEVADPAQETSQKLYKWLSQDWVRTALFVVQVASLAAAAYAGEVLRETRSGAEWLTERRAAEKGRIDFFDKIMTVAAENGPDAERAAFAHFVDNQLNGQLAFHEAAEARHRHAAGRSIVFGAIVAAAVAAGGAASGAAGIGGEIWVAIAALIGVLAPILLNTLRSWRESTLDREKSERYRAAWADLKQISGEVDAARRAIEAGDPSPARDIVTRVHVVMRAENETWAPTAGQT